jgi:nicotinamide-nucleotide amidase
VSEAERAHLVALASRLLDQAYGRRLSIVTAESCTGGLVSELLTAVPGSSRVVWGAFVTYSNDAKVRVLGVPMDSIESAGAVSEEVVRAMVAGALARSSADIAVAVSGVAGPGGGTEEKPVGTVWLAAGERGREAIARLCKFDGDRDSVRRLSAAAALQLLLEFAE